jgi:ABC-2 type transport system ATP-binding protein
MQQEVYHLLKEARANGTTVFFSSHIISEVESLAERVAIIRAGRIAEEAQPGHLASMARRRIRIRFKQPVEASGLAAVDGVSSLSSENGLQVSLQLEGEMDGLIKALAAFPVSDMQTEHHTLEEIFLAYYQAGEDEEDK